MHVTPSAVYLMIKKPVARQVIRSCLIICLKKHKPMEADPGKLHASPSRSDISSTRTQFPFLRKGEKNDAQ